MKMFERVWLPAPATCLAILGLTVGSASALGLFEAAAGADDDKKQAYELNGYIRGTFYGGKVPQLEEAEVKSAYGEAAAKLRIKKQPLGDAYAELRYRSGYEFEREIHEFSLREGYVNTYVGPFDFRLGKQIVVWGRADGVNPTNNLTPQNMLVRSPDEDDRREGNLIFRGFYILQPFRLEGIWVPIFRSSVLPLHLVELPDNVSIGEANYPDGNFENSGLAGRLNLELARFDGSLSYFNGYHPLPGFDAAVDLTALSPTVTLIPRAYRIHAAGFDFATTLGSFMGLRGEAAYKHPTRNYEDNIYIPNPDLQYVLGADKEYGDITILVQYVGKYVFDFQDISGSASPLDEFQEKNRMFAFQQDEVSHSAFARLGWKLMHETFNLDLSGMYNFTTEELLARPKAAYDITDDLEVAAGAEIYLGPEGALFDVVEERLSAGFLELKASF